MSDIKNSELLEMQEKHEVPEAYEEPEEQEEREEPEDTEFWKKREEDHHKTLAKIELRAEEKIEKWRIRYERYLRKQGTTHDDWDIFQDGTGTAYLSGTQSDPSERLEELRLLIKVCNTHYQAYLLRDKQHVHSDGKKHRGHLFPTRCHKHRHPVRCNEEVWTGDMSDYGDSYSTTCECGCSHQWNMKGFDPTDIDQFNIEHTKPFGYESTSEQ
jgi:hypothetical protein